jgi:hypothetical protein
MSFSPFRFFGFSRIYCSFRNVLMPFKLCNFSYRRFLDLVHICNSRSIVKTGKECRRCKYRNVASRHTTNNVYTTRQRFQGTNNIYTTPPTLPNISIPSLDVSLKSRRHGPLDNLPVPLLIRQCMCDVITSSEKLLLDLPSILFR